MDFFREDLPEEFVALTAWKILIVDDDEDMHRTTIYALSRCIVNSRPLEFISAFSGAEAQEIVKYRTDIDIMLLDSVMETDHAGIDCARYIRDKLNRKLPIIIMRSGFTGWETEIQMKKVSFIDDFVLKSKTTRQVLLDLLSQWLPKS